MTYSTGSGGYDVPPQSGPVPTYGQPQTPAYGVAPAVVPGQPAGRGLPYFLNVGVVVLGVLSFLLGFAPYASLSEQQFGYSGGSINFFQNNGPGVIGLGLLLAAAVIAGLGLLPKQPDHEAVVAGLSVSGFLVLLFMLIGLLEYDAEVGLILVLVAAFIQAALAVAVMLTSTGIIKTTPPGQPAAYGSYGHSAYGQPQPGYEHPQQPSYGQSPPQGYGQSQPGYGQSAGGYSAPAPAPAPQQQGGYYSAGQHAQSQQSRPPEATTSFQPPHIDPR